jgi:hypothetical protein
MNLSSIYQKSVPLRSGLYRLDVVRKDAQSGNVGVIDAALRVPLYEEESSRQLPDPRRPNSARSVPKLASAHCSALAKWCLASTRNSSPRTKWALPQL